MKKFLTLIMILTIAVSSKANIADFDNLTLDSQSYWNGYEGRTDGYYEVETFTSGPATFNNYNGYDVGYSYSYWGNFAYSKMVDTIGTGFSAQYSAQSLTGGAHSGDNFGVVFADAPTITFGTELLVETIQVTNTRYAYDSMLNGDGFAKQFGANYQDSEQGPELVNMDAPDWFMLTITGKDDAGEVTGTYDFYLADYRFEDNLQDYIIDDWTSVDLTSLGAVKTLEFALSSSDTGDFGMNTPAYFAIDTIVPEPMTIVLLGLGGLVIRKRK